MDWLQSLLWDPREDHRVSEQIERAGSAENRSGKFADRPACALYAPFPAGAYFHAFRGRNPRHDPRTHL